MGTEINWVFIYKNFWTLEILLYLFMNCND